MPYNKDMVGTIGKTSVINFGVWDLGYLLLGLKGGMFPSTQKVDMLNCIPLLMPQVAGKLRRHDLYIKMHLKFFFKIDVSVGLVNTDLCLWYKVSILL